jgi:CheY-like chemotaxis protein
MSVIVSKSALVVSSGKRDTITLEALRTVRTALESLDYQVIDSATVNGALEVCAQEDIDLVFSTLSVDQATVFDFIKRAEQMNLSLKDVFIVTVGKHHEDNPIFDTASKFSNARLLSIRLNESQRELTEKLNFYLSARS